MGYRRFPRQDDPLIRDTLLELDPQILLMYQTGSVLPVVKTLAVQILNGSWIQVVQSTCERCDLRCLKIVVVYLQAD